MLMKLSKSEPLVAAKMVDISFSDVKLSSAEKVVPMSEFHNAVVVRGKNIVVSPTVLLMQVTCVIKDSKDMARYICYELAQQPHLCLTMK